jgi:hypothetical protein
MMTLEEFAQHRKQLNDMCSGILESKGRAYTRASNDKLANFKKTAEDLGISIELAWAVYFHKHLDSLMHYIKNNEEGPEGITENIKDARNYLDLFYAILVEKNAVPDIPFVVEATMQWAVGSTSHHFHGDYHPEHAQNNFVWDHYNQEYIDEDEFDAAYMCDDEDGAEDEIGY